MKYVRSLIKGPGVVFGNSEHISHLFLVFLLLTLSLYLFAGQVRFANLSVPDLPWIENCQQNLQKLFCEGLFGLYQFFVV